MHVPISRKLFAAMAAAFAISAPVAAQQQTDFAKVEIKSTRLADDLYVLEGQGGAITALTGADGVLLVDSQFAPLTEKIVAALRKFSDKPIRYLVDTHLHGDHVGGNENFARLGATLVARDSVRWRLAHPVPTAAGAPGKPAAPSALPPLTFEGTLALHIDGEDVSVVSLPNAHTDGDVLVVFPRHDVIAAGDIFRTTGYPYADLNNGGSLKGLVDALGIAIGLAGPNTRVVPGHGPIADRAALIAQRDLLLTVRDRVAGLVARGKTLEEAIAAKPTADLDAGVPQGAQSAERFVKWLYAELKAGR